MASNKKLLNSEKFTRRDFVKSATAAGGALMLVQLVLSLQRPRSYPNRISLASSTSCWSRWRIVRSIIFSVGYPVQTAAKWIEFH